ncbi:MAG: tRNA (adenosine(37)-N6)-threonylcarbamoyltransferase complex dimerization subunit type 1 TsaB [Gammaproteobacteria bacterium]|nr:tRNA (adenosine(37)-N6)-threonylcarbamoyltransferase complex dimerization subunit type 1 TsaB [Gammaproteobacteria bacterium]
MTNILAIDTSTEACSAALYVDGKITSRYEFAPQRHALLLLPFCDELLAEANLTPADLSAVAFGRGPGSFTGVRIAAAAAQGIATAHHIPVISVSTLQTLAQVAYQENQCAKVYAGIDARMSEIYFGRFEAKNNIMELVGEEVVAPLEKLGLSKHDKTLRVGSAFQTKDILYPHAEMLLTIAIEKFKNKETLSAELALPVYLRDNVV